MVISPEILSIVLGGVIVWLAAASFFLLKTIRHYHRLIKGTDKDNLEKILEKILKDIKVEKEARVELAKVLEKLEKESGYHFQRMGLTRYNPFSETGGNQSFVLALLDGNDSGLVISSLHGREQTRIYAKPIKKGKGDGYELSKEEEEVVRKAKKIK